MYIITVPSYPCHLGKKWQISFEQGQDPLNNGTEMGCTLMSRVQFCWGEDDQKAGGTFKLGCKVGGSEEGIQGRMQ